MDASVQLDSLALANPDGEQIKAEIFADDPYISKCRKQTDIAMVSVVQKSNLKSSSPENSPSELRSNSPAPSAKPLPVPKAQQAPAPVVPEDDYLGGELPKPPTRTDSSGVIVKQKSIIAQAQHFKSILNEKLSQSLTQSMARTATKKQVLNIIQL